MKILIDYGENVRRCDIAKKVKILAKNKGLKVKDIGYATITHIDFGFCLAIYTNDHKFITNCVC